jgi:hypothetical protein
MSRDDPLRAAIVVGPTANIPQPDECKPEPLPATSNQCIELTGPSLQYEPFNTRLANRKSEVSSPSLNFA